MSHFGRIRQDFYMNNYPYLVAIVEILCIYHRKNVTKMTSHTWRQVFADSIIT